MSVISMSVKLDVCRRPLYPSWPGLSRPSTSTLFDCCKDVDARDKPGHDDLRQDGSASMLISGQSGLLAGGREQVSAAADGADHRGLGWIDLDFAPDSHDSQIDGAIECLGVARIGEFQETLS
jgi:hypothetical protein